MINAIDLFCGAGGLTKGLEKKGIKVCVGVDIDPDCEYPYVENTNAVFLKTSVTEVSGKDLKNYLKKDSKYLLLAGCAPCQPFSGYRKGIEAKSDDRWKLLKEFKRLVTEIKPDFITMENVPRLTNESVFKDFVKSLNDKSYYVSYQVVDCSEYGIPQKRNRLVLLASRLGEIKIIDPTHKGKKVLTVKKVIGKLPPIQAGKSHSKDPMHAARNLTPINLERIKKSKPGGTWRDWDKDLVAKCHKKKSGSTYPSVYGRMSWDEPAPTITTQFFGFGNGRFGHPEQNRAISLREGAIIQTFPKNYKFSPKDSEISFEKMGRLIGNAVPVKLGEVIGESIRLHIRSVKKKKPSGKK